MGVLEQLEVVLRERFPNARIVRHGGEMFIHDGLAVLVECKSPLSCRDVVEEVGKARQAVEVALRGKNARTSMLLLELQTYGKYVVELDITVFRGGCSGQN